MSLRYYAENKKLYRYPSFKRGDMFTLRVFMNSIINPGEGLLSFPSLKVVLWLFSLLTMIIPSGFSQTIPENGQVLLMDSFDRLSSDWRGVWLVGGIGLMLRRLRLAAGAGGVLEKGTACHDHAPARSALGGFAA